MPDSILGCKVRFTGRYVESASRERERINRAAKRGWITRLMGKRCRVKWDDVRRSATYRRDVLEVSK